MQFEIIPFKSVGPISFGMTRDEVRALFETAPQENSHPDVSIPSDEWIEIGVRVDYSPEGGCEAVLFTASAASPMFREKALLEHPHREMCAWLREIDGEAVFPDENEKSLVSYTFGFMLGAPRADEPEETSKSMGVLVWEQGYWADT